MTNPLELLDEAARLLREDLAPALTGVARYHSLLAAKAIDTARREFALAPQLAVLEAALPTTSAPLREGRHDHDDALYTRILDAMIVRACIADPRALNSAEHERLEELSR